MRHTDLISNNRRHHFLTSYRHYLVPTLQKLHANTLPFELRKAWLVYIAKELNFFTSQPCSLSKHPMLMHRMTWLLIFILTLKIIIFL
jgi:hypothetical protein